jgi:hypothetical protein
MGYNKIMKNYTPKKKKYNTLGTFRDELEENKIKVTDFVGHTLSTKHMEYCLVDGQVYGRPVDGKK